MERLQSEWRGMVVEAIPLASLRMWDQAAAASREIESVGHGNDDTMPTGRREWTAAPMRASHPSPRYEIDLPLFFKAGPPELRTAKTGSGRTQNLSETGACVELTSAFPPRTPLRLAFQNGRDIPILESRVIWAAAPTLPGGGALHGVAFPQIAPDQRQALRTLLQQKGSGHARAHRLPAALPVMCHPPGVPVRALQGWTGDLGRGGCSLLLPEQLPVGTPVAIVVTTPRGEIRAKATIVWAESSGPIPAGQLARHGVRLTDPNWSRDLILGLVSRAAREQDTPDRGT